MNARRRKASRPQVCVNCGGYFPLTGGGQTYVAWPALHQLRHLWEVPAGLLPFDLHL